ncbi:hypothetical protein P154DRAFT_614834 [Amniculicola lignicola CBS 123094]|uniref:F-box domain-containing protein n=1 Tax=Amniculicola lignicola CBS 123094 TaxID=1392246 RepID=A0A6A5X3I7_9PLEO|nr:hypothetical protein P154DRAFT_614834 [Amniculicola lignicola CBS 123094]
MSRPRARCKISDLPPELRLSVAAKLQSNSDLCRLSLANKQFQDVAQDTLLKNLKLRGTTIRKVVKTLLDRPDLACKISHIDLGDYESEAGSALESFGASDLLKCLQLLKSAVVDEDLRYWIVSTMVSQPGTAPPGVRFGSYTHNRTFFLAILVAVASCLMSLTIELPAVAPEDTVNLLSQAAQFDKQGYQAPFEGPVLAVLRNRLCHFNISEPARWKGLAMHNLVLHDLDALTRLSVPLAALVRKNMIANPPHQVLPSGLKHLELQVGADGQRFYSFVGELFFSIARRLFPKLRQIDAYFPFCPRSLINFVGYTDDVGMLEMVEEILQKLDMFGIGFATYFGKEKKLGDLGSELNARLELSDTEAWLTAMRGEQYSTTLARQPDPIVRRKAMVLETRLSLKNPQDLGRLFSSPTLDLESLSNVRFFGGIFGGIQGTNKSKKDSSSNVSKTILTEQNADSALENTSEIEAKNESKEEKEEQKSETNSPAATEAPRLRSKRKARKPKKAIKDKRKRRFFSSAPVTGTEKEKSADALPLELTFDPNKWLKVRFFETPGDARSRQEADTNSEANSEPTCSFSRSRAEKKKKDVVRGAGERTEG